MDINVDKIKEALSFDPTNESWHLTAADLLKKADEKQLTTSELGRRYSQEDYWDFDTDAAFLNDQLFSKLPLPAIAININGDNSNGVKKAALWCWETLDNSAWSIVDGKQRLSVIYDAWSSKPDYDEVNYDIVFNLVDGAFEYIDDIPSKEEVPVDFILNKDQQKLTDYITKRFSDNEVKEVTPLLFGIRNKILNYTYTILTANDLTKEEQQNWYRILH